MSSTTLALKWDAPTDTGCLAIADYKIQSWDGSTWNDEVTGITATTKTLTGLTAGGSKTLRVVARNSINFGTPSSSITLVPTGLPNAPTPITVTSYGKDFLALQWVLPTDTGIGDTSVPIIKYKLEVDDGFGNGFVTLSEQVGLTYSHTSLITGHTYSYRVSGENFAGYGAVSGTFSFKPRTIPGAPPKAP